MAARARVARRGLAAAQEPATGLVAGAAAEGPAAVPERAAVVEGPVVGLEPVAVLGAAESSGSVSYPEPAAFPQFCGIAANPLGRA